MTKPLKAIVLGGTLAHIPLLKNLKSRGYHTILIDYYRNPVAKEYADEHIMESTLNKEAVLKIAQDRKVDLIITSSIDQANVVAVYVSEKLGLPIPYSYETSLLVTDKEKMKSRMEFCQIPTSKFTVVEDDNIDGLSGFNFPLIVKPSDSNGSKGVKKCDNRQELKENLSNAFKYSRNGKVIIEEYIEGVELGLDCVVGEKSAEVLTWRKRRKLYSNDKTQQIVGTISPASLSDALKEKIQKVINQICQCFNLKNTPLMVQMIVNKEDVYVIEFAPRIGGGESANIIRKSTGYDMIDAAVNSFLGKKIDLEYIPQDEYYAENLIYAYPGKFDSIEGLEELVNEGIVEYYSIYKTKGMIIEDHLMSINRIGAFVVKGKTRKEVQKKIDLAVRNIKVRDVNGNEIMRRDINYFDL